MDELARRIELNTTAHYQLVAQRMPGFTMNLDDDIHWYSSGLADGFFNGASWCGFGRDVDRRLDEIVGWFAARGLPCRFWVGPSSQPDDLGERLLALGFGLIFDAPGMARDLAVVSDAVPAGCVIERVRDDDGLRAFLAVILGAYDRPADPYHPWFPVYAAVGYDSDSPVHHYLGFIDGEPVGAATGVIAAGIVGIYHVHVLSRFRGRGLGSAMTRAPMLDARALGISAAGLHSTPMGESVYRRLGFVERCRFGVYQTHRR